MLLSFAAYLPTLALAAAILYAAFHVTLCVGMFRRKPPGSDRHHRISVIVAARNEANRIATLLQALHEQSRSPDEIIVVDDRSEDSTVEVVEGFRHVLPQLRIVRVAELPSGNAPKKNALDAGIRSSTGEIICCTDADCIPPSTWVAGLEQGFEETTGVVAGLYAPIWDDRAGTPSMLSGTIRRFVEYERFKTSALLLGSIGVGMPWLASGSNLAYRRRVFDDVGGFSGHMRSMSGDDDLFVQQVRRTTDWQVSAVAGPDTTVRTHIPDRWGEFARQRARHFSAGRFYDPVTRTLLGLYHASNLIATVALFAAIFFPLAGLATAYVVKLSADLVLLVAADIRIQRARAWTWFVPLELLNVLYLLVVGPMGWLGHVRWKERQAS